ncbi:protein OCTOPUS-like [Lolium perenne]|uniref:protein OCTOPUS-like n=1 Tax=Lolium perenne TaxID=4522 RepID=UPI0021EA60FD|nr:protein OCTOPUS-like [Lolium perenne]
MSLQMDPPAPPARRSNVTSCDLHPDEAFTGFCAACLRERLAGLEASAAAASAPGRKSTSAIRSLFARPFVAGAGSSAAGAATEPPDLRRCKSFSCGRGGDVLSAAAAAAAAAARGDEPQRHSCDVRGRATLWALFHQDDRDRVRDGTAFGSFPVSSSAAAAVALNTAVPLPVPPQHPPPRVLEDFSEEDIPVVMEYSEDEITEVVEEPVLLPAADTSSGEIIETEPNVRAMKEHMDLESSDPAKPAPALKEIAGSFWVAASVFSKKWQKWRRKQKLKKDAAVSKAAAAAMPPPEKPSKPSFLRRRRLRGEAGSEHALGRRSCDTDPRFSLDAGRMSVDDAGFNWDEPRASWDGYLFGAGAGGALGRAPPPLTRLPPILSAMEDAPGGPVVERSDGQIPVEDDADPEPPGGSFQTRDYYLDSSSRRRRSLERTSSVRRPSFEVPELQKPAANGNESPPPIGGGPEFYHFHHAEDLLDRGFSSNSLVEDISASLEAALSGGASCKKPPRWRKAWSLWGFIHRRAAGRRAGGGGPSDIADRSFSEPWPDLRVRGGAGGGSGMQRCGSNLSARSSFSSNSGGLGSSRRSYVDVHGNVRRRGEELHPPSHGLERNRSARHSPGRGSVDNGMLRFYLTPMRSGGGGARRGGGGGGVPGKAAAGRNQLTSQSFARSVLRLY